MVKGGSMAQWMNLLQNSRFVNLTIIRTLIVRKTEALAPVEHGLTSVRLSGRLADKKSLVLEIFKIH